MANYGVRGGLAVPKKSISGGLGVVTYGKDLHQIHKKQQQINKTFGKGNLGEFSLKGDSKVRAKLHGTQNYKNLKMAKSKKVSASALKGGKNKIKGGVKKGAGGALDYIENNDETGMAGAVSKVARNTPGALRATKKTVKGAYKFGKGAVKAIKAVPKAVKATATAIKTAAMSTKGLVTAIVATGPVGIGILLGTIALILIIILMSSLAFNATNRNVGKLTGAEAALAQTLMSYGYDKIHVAGIMGNTAVESHCNPKAFQPEEEREHLEGEERTD